MKKIIALLFLAGTSAFAQVSNVTINGQGTVLNETVDHNPKQIKFATGQLLVNGVAVVGGSGVTAVTGTAPIVSSGGTTPAISITAATTGAPGSMSAADKTKLDAITGTNTGNQTITLTGDVTGTGTGSFAATITNDAVTYAKMQNVTAQRILGRGFGSAGDPQEITISDVLDLLAPSVMEIPYRDSFGWDTLAAGPEGTILMSHGGVIAPTWEVPSGGSGFISNVAFAATWNGDTLNSPSKNAAYDWGHTFDTDDDGKVNVLDVAAGIVKTDSNGVVSVGGANFTDLSGSIAVGQVPNDLITYAKIQNVSATSRILGRKTAGAGDAEELTFSEVLDFVSSAARGDILYRGASTWSRLPAGTDGKVLTTHGASADPTWETPSGGGGGVVGFAIFDTHGADISGLQKLGVFTAGDVVYNTVGVYDVTFGSVDWAASTIHVEAFMNGGTMLHASLDADSLTSTACTVYVYAANGTTLTDAAKRVQITIEALSP